jgi:hypothetical protein
MLWGFKLSFVVDIFAFWLGDCLGYFFEKLGKFFTKLLVTLLGLDICYGANEE